MSHSKMTKRGYSLYVEQWNPSAKRFINTCKVCGHRGYSPSIECEGFCDTPKNRAIYTELKQTLRELALDEYGRCEICARLSDGAADKNRGTETVE